MRGESLRPDLAQVAVRCCSNAIVHMSDRFLKIRACTAKILDLPSLQRQQINSHKWLPGLIEQHNNTASTHRSLRKFEMQSNLQLLKSCLQGNENWNIIKQIPWIKVLASSDNDCDFCGAVYICFLLHLDPLNWYVSPFEKQDKLLTITCVGRSGVTIQSETTGERSKTWHTDFRKIAMIQFSARAPLIASLQKGLASKPVEGPPLALEGVDHVHGSDRLAASVLSVGHGVSDDILEEDLEYATGLLVDQAADALDAAAAGEAAYRRLGDALNVVAEDLAVALSAALAKPLASLAAAGHGDDLDRESRRLLQKK
ncbi:hypothetical protein ZIOFF_027892 [Zingiber officinale]|uniref:Uncharacterized protein n=1 Tax=Zingiber officinale TaxID=94328 RepID=A0A8J5GM36_ZINOF|nr:hypothetical protein ZIOFF_027892 [Zingiber officinale]